MVLSTRTKECRLKYMEMGKIFAIVSLLTKFIPLQCFTMAQYIALKGEMEDRTRAFLSIWKDIDQGIHYLMRKTPNIFCF